MMGQKEIREPFLASCPDIVWLVVVRMFENGVLGRLLFPLVFLFGVLMIDA